jgi:hypothetical protein
MRAKTHVVMRGDIGHCLVNGEENNRRLALHALIQQLAHVAYAQILDESLPGVLLNKLKDSYDAFLYPYVDAAWGDYFASRASATFNPEVGQGYREILVAVLKRARSDILPARLSYRYHGQLDQLLQIALPRVQEILRFSAKVLGHYDGLRQPVLEDQSLTAALNEAGLRDWLILFDAELSELWGRTGKWASFREFLALNRHVERLLWQFGLFPWKTEDGQIRVEVPIATDAHNLVGLAAAVT